VIGARLGLGLTGRRRRVLLPAVFEFDGGVMGPGVTFARASTAYGHSASSLLAPFAINAPRFVPNGILLEPAATNRLTRSATFTSWTNIRATIVSSSVADPAGGTAATLLRTIGTDTSFLVRGCTVVASADYAFSLFVRAPATGAALKTRLDTNNASTGGTGITGAQALTSSWARMQISGAVSNTTSCNASIGNYAGTTYDPDAVGDMEIFGAQIELGSVATSYIPTAGSVASRAADVLTLPWGSRGVANGAVMVRYTFDNNSTQDVLTTIAGGVAAVPTNLNRPVLKRAELAP
jgi:hypothetical protein